VSQRHDRFVALHLHQAMCAAVEQAGIDEQLA